MKKMLKIFYISPEVFPFTPLTPCAKVAGGLPIALKDLGHDIRVMMPNYKCINARKYVLRDVIRLKDMKVSLGGETIEVSAKSAFLPNSKVQIYFLDKRELFARDGLYADPKLGKPFADNMERFMIFCLGCIETLRMLHWQPDVIHCNDWPTAFFTVYFQHIIKQEPLFKKTKIVHSLFDFQSEARVSQSLFQKAGMVNAMEMLAPYAQNGEIDVLRAAMHCADAAFVEDEAILTEGSNETPVSPPIRALLTEVKDKVLELGSGIDTAVWDPATDTFLHTNYDIDSIEKKAENKSALCSSLELEDAPHRPLILLQLALTQNRELKGVVNALEAILSQEVSLLAIVDAENAPVDKLKALAKKLPGCLAICQSPDERLRHQAMAGADLYLAPVWAEPFLTNHLIGLHYGTLPIVNSVDGFLETVRDYFRSAKSANGFAYNSKEEGSLVETVQIAAEAYKDRNKWEGMVKNAMKQDYAWHAVAPKYVQKLTALF